MRPFNTNYSGRQVDIEWLQTITRPTVATTTLQLAFTTNTKIVTGMQKLAQRFTLTFLTSLGDVHFDTGFGTTFWVNALRGATQNIGQVTVAVNQAILSALTLMQVEDQASDTYGAAAADDQINDAELLTYDIDRNSGTLLLKIGLTNQAGDNYTYVLPVQAVRT